MNEEVKRYLQGIIDREDYLQLLEDLFTLASGIEDEQEKQKEWKRKVAFCQQEVIPNMDFLISVTKDN